MSVPRGKAAVDRLRALLDSPQPDLPYVETEPLPDGVEPRSPTPWLWDRPSADVPQRRALRDPQAYALDDDAAQARLLQRAPDDVLTGEGALTQGQLAYARRSIDVTMKGGTTSGVIYPLAVCELARRFHVRNVGGSSAGAVAAAMAAAAELGRTSWDAAGRPDLVAPRSAARSQGRLRPGFVGLADSAAWLSQADDGGREEFRIAQLFRPTTSARPAFRLLVALMRRRWASFATLLLWSFGPVSRVVTGLVLALAPVVAVVGTNAATRYGPVRSWLFAALVLGLGTAAVIHAVASILAVLEGLAARRARIDRRLREPVLPLRTVAVPSWSGNASTALGAALVLVLLARLQIWSMTGGWRLLGGWLFLLVATVVVQVVALRQELGRARRLKFGLVSGAVSVNGFRLRGRVRDAVAGLSPPTLTHALVPWLDRALSDLAALDVETLAGKAPGRPGAPKPVLRFGHLWLGADYRPPDPHRPRTPDELERLRQAADNPRLRRVNLELMSTELVHGVPYRFPLRRCDAQEKVQGNADDALLVRRRDFRARGAEVFPLDVVNALCPPGGELEEPAYDVETGDRIDDLYPLPEPWDLPVVFAARVSVALPVLLQSVRVYRRVVSGGRRIRDDYGAALRRTGARGEELRYPTGQRHWVEELWFSDGGITSNFPIHLFDNPLPLWPTVGINFGPHPRGFGHQDVYLPTSAQALSSPPTPQRRGMAGFMNTVVETALGWSDTGQTFMPSSRGRVAWVRQDPDEGGNNIFISSTTVASLALRGALAGRRIAERFAHDAHWQVHQWLRLRVALDNLATLHSRVVQAARTPPYADLSSASELDAVKDALQQAGGDPSPAYAGSPDAPLTWFDPPRREAFDAATTALLDCYAAMSPGADLSALREGGPQPAPELRQVPPG